ncbi:MAG: helix-turn-helix transcriptional regulator [Lachnospiraceae bacterium]|nr:helix-turn-helix transcriptional regulator [Lachnospiraceae bacterium]
MNKKKSIITSWIYSYILILLIPILTIFINYYYNNKVIENQIIHANQLVLHNLQQSVDNHLYNEVCLYTYVLTSDEFFNLISHERVNKEFYSDAWDTKMLLDTHHNQGSNISYLLYLKEKDYMLWSGIIHLSEICYKSKCFPDTSMPPYEEWMTMLSKEYNNEFMVTSYFNYTSTKPCLVYADTVAYKGFESVNMFFYIPISDIASLVTPLNDGTLLLIHSQNEVLLALDNQGMSEVTPDIQESIYNNEAFTTDSYVVLREESSQTKLSYSLLIPQNTFWQESQHVRNVLFLSLTGTLIIGSVCVYFLVNRNFQPISKLLLKTTGEVKKGNEYSQIESAFLHLDSENKQMRSRMLTQRELMQKNYLLAMMKGKYSSIQKQEQLHIDFYLNENEDILLVGYEVPMLDKHQLKHDDLLWFTIDNIFTELMSHEKMYRIEDGKYLFYLFIVPKNNSAVWKEGCLEKMNILCDLLEDKWGISVPSAISTFESKMEQIRFLYQDIMDAIEYKDVIGGRGVIDTATLKDAPDTLSIKSTGMFIEMALLQGDYDKILSLSQELFDNSSRTPFLIFRMQVLEVFYVVAKFYEHHETADGQRIFLAGYLSPLLNAPDKDAMKKVFDELLSYVYRSTYDQDDDKHLVAVIREYIETHFTDSSMNISTIADAIGKKSRHISRVFKEETQEGILDYINELRISKAKLLLRTEKYSLEEISAMVGYASYKTFRRIFVKLTGVTPGKYGGRQSDNSLEE